MKIPERFKGYLFAILATVAMANVYVFSKAALNELSLYQFGFFWFGMAILWNLFYAIPAGKFKLVKTLAIKEIRILVFLGLLEMIGTALFFLSIKATTDPAIMSFLQNLVPLFVIIMGVGLLGERFTIFQVAGMIITLTGAVVTSFTGDMSETGFFVPGTGFMIASSFFLAIIMIVSRRFIKKLDPGILALNRSVFLFLMAFILMLVNSEPFTISGTALLNTLFGSLLGPFLTAISTYSALKFIEASKSSIIQSSKGLFVLIGSWMYFDTIPKSFQVLGGIITITGVIILITAKDKIKKSDQ